MKATSTMTPQEQAKWKRSMSTSVKVPTHQHVYAMLRASGMRWVDINAFFAGVHINTIKTGVQQHDTSDCWWCMR